VLLGPNYVKFGQNCTFSNSASSAVPQSPLCLGMLGSNPGLSRLWLWHKVGRSYLSARSHPQNTIPFNVTSQGTFNCITSKIFIGVLYCSVESRKPCSKMCLTGLVLQFLPLQCGFFRLYPCYLSNFFNASSQLKM
jgi:hypothetical protein